MMTSFKSFILSPRGKSKDSLGSNSASINMVQNQTEESSKETLLDDVEENNLPKADQCLLEQEDCMFGSSQSSDDFKDSLSNDSTSTDVAEHQNVNVSNSGSVPEKRKYMLKNAVKMIKTSFMTSQNSTIPDTPREVPLDFSQNLEQNHLAEASHILLAQEDRLFRSSQLPEEQTILTEDEDNLQKDYETLMLRVRMAIAESFKKENQDTLKSAVITIVQQEEQDRHWEKMTEVKCPPWRPLKCRQVHDSLVQQVVKEQMQRSDGESGAEKLSTSLKRELCQMGRCIQKDLLWVVRNMGQSYPTEFDICNLYAQLYHKAFSRKLKELTQSNLDLSDLTYTLCWIHDYYPRSVLEQKELKPHINTKSLAALLPEEDLKTLQEQYVSQNEVEVRKWFCNVLTKEKESWQTNKLELIDGYYFSNLSLDILQLLNGAMQEAVTVSCNNDNAQRILLQLDSFLDSYKKCIDKLIKEKHANLPDILKAQLVCIKQLREYIEQQNDLPDKVKTSWLLTLSDLKDSCNKYFITAIHKDLKAHYKILWTPAWFSEHQNIIGDVLCILEDKMHCVSNLKPDCMEELFSLLHFEVMSQYVQRMLKQKLKLKNKDEQEAAADFLCSDSDRLNTLFISHGSKEKWLSNIFLKVSEILRLQGTEALQLEVVMLGREYPDVSEHHVDALLQLKANLSGADRRSIKKILVENRESLNSKITPGFFSKIPVKKLF